MIDRGLEKYKPVRGQLFTVYCLGPHMIKRQPYHSRDTVLVNFNNCNSGRLIQGRLHNTHSFILYIFKYTEAFN